MILTATPSPLQPWCCLQSTTSRAGRLQPKQLAGDKSTWVKRSHYALVDGGSAHCRTGSSHACYLEQACAQQSPRRCPEVDGNHSQQRVWSQGACSRSIWRCLLVQPHSVLCAPPQPPAIAGSERDGLNACFFSSCSDRVDVLSPPAGRDLQASGPSAHGL